MKKIGQKWRADIAGIRENTWSSNSMTYDSPDEVQKWLNELRNRWFGYDMARIVSNDTPRNESIDMSDSRIVQNFRR